MLGNAERFLRVYCGSDWSPVRKRKPGETRSFTAAVHELAEAQKSGAGVPAYLRYVNRPLGRLAAAAAYVLGLNPNQVTALSGVFSLASLVALATIEPSGPLGVLVALGLALGYVLDSADGQLARLYRGGSLAGEWLDHVVDAARMPAVHLAVVIALFRFHDDLSSATLLIPLAFLFVTVVRFFSQILAEQMRRYSPALADDGVTTSGSVSRSLIALPGDFGLICLSFLLWGNVQAFLAIYSLLLIAGILLLPAGLARRYRELANATR